jgi:HEPN domain
MPQASLTIRLEGPRPDDATSIFHQGQAFFMAGKRCLLEIPVGPGMTQCLVSPGVVNLCLSAELLMKALLVASGQKSEKTHKLPELFAALPRDDQDAVRASYSSVVQEPDLDALLDRVGGYFVKVRYGHEFEIFGFEESLITIFADTLYRHTAKKLGHTTSPPHVLSNFVGNSGLDRGHGNDG